MKREIELLAVIFDRWEIYKGKPIEDRLKEEYIPDWVFQIREILLNNS